MRQQSGATILAVDDGADSRGALVRTLLGAGFAVREAATAGEGLRLAAELPDLIIIEIDLPDRSGLEVCRALKDDPATAAIPVVQVSPRLADSRGRAEGLAGGADAFLAAPVDPEELVATVNALLRARRAEEEVRRSARDWRATFDALSDGVCLLDRDGRVRRLNRALQRLLGRPFADIVGRTCEELSPEVWGDGHDTPGCRVLRSHAREQDELRRGERWFRVTADPVFSEGGTFEGATCVVSDVTEARRAREALARSEERFRLANEAVRGTVYDIDWRSGRVERSPGLYALVGYLPAEAEPVREWWLGLVHPDDRERVRHRWEQAIADEARLSEEYRVRHRDGRYVWVWDRGLFVRDAAGRVARAVGCAVDVTGRKEAERLVRETALALAHAMPGIACLDREGRYVEVNADYAGALGCWPADLIGRDWGAAVHPDDRAAAAAAYEAMRRDGKAELEARVLRADGSAFHAHALLVRRTDDHGGAAGHHCFLRDVSDRKRAEEALKEADHRKDDFLAMLGHELRNPLAPIRNALSILRLAGPPGPTLQEARAVIDRQVTHMARLIDDLLDVSRIGRGRVLLRRERCDLVPLVRAAAEDYRRVLAAARLALALDLPPGPVWVEGDPTRLAQAVGNLLHNAHKFTGPGGEVTVRLAEADGRAVVSVRDTGIGIAPEVLPHLFVPFTRAGRGQDHGGGGLGLGLALVKGLVELHGGSVDAASAGPGRGSEFTFRLPLLKDEGRAMAEGPSAEADAGPAPPACRVLVIEDNRDAALSLRMLLELVGHGVEVAYDGAAGIEAARSFRPDVVLCDLGLPGGADGFEVARTLRRDDGLPSAFLIALSGYATADDRRQALAAGFDLHLTKPVTFEDLQRALAGRRRD